jgi:hypothetical protein
LIIYVDKFWNSIENDIWVLLDNELIKWFEYKDISKGKEKLVKIIKENDISSKYHKILNNDQFKSYSPTAGEQDSQWGGSNKQHILIEPNYFKKVCMRIGTSKSEEIMDYFLEIEKIFKFYNKYILAFNKNEFNNTAFILNININKTLLKNNGKLYLATTINYARQNIFKFGRTENEKNRMSTYNTGRIGNDKYFYVKIFDCFDATTLEKRIEKLLVNFKIQNENEMYQLHFTALDNIITELCNSNNESIEKINSFITNEYDQSLNLQPLEFNN